MARKSREVDPILARERRLRRLVRNHGCRLKKNRVRDPARPGHHGFMIVEGDSELPVMGHTPFPYSLKLDQVEGWVSRHEQEALSGAR